MDWAVVLGALLGHEPDALEVLILDTVQRVEAVQHDLLMSVAPAGEDLGTWTPLDVLALLEHAIRSLDVPALLASEKNWLTSVGAALFSAKA
jgi:hypothetical protein